MNLCYCPKPDIDPAEFKRADAAGKAPVCRRCNQYWDAKENGQTRRVVSDAPGPRVGPPSESRQKRLTKLLAKGRVEPILEDRPCYQLQVGWKRKGASRHAETWMLNTARPWRQPWAVLQRSRGAELITDERRRQQNVLGYDAARDSNYTDHELGKAAICYLLAATQLEKGDAPAEVRTLGDDAMFKKMWPAEWDEVHFKPGSDPIRCRVKCGALFWAEADRLVRAGVTDDRLRQCLNAIDAQVEHIDRLLTKTPVAAPGGAS